MSNSEYVGDQLITSGTDNFNRERGEKLSKGIDISVIEPDNNNDYSENVKGDTSTENIIIPDTTVTTHLYETRSKVKERYPSYQANPYAGLEEAERRSRKLTKSKLTRSERDIKHNRKSRSRSQSKERQIVKEILSEVVTQALATVLPLSDSEVDTLETIVDNRDLTPTVDQGKALGSILCL